MSGEEPSSRRFLGRLVTARQATFSGLGLATAALTLVFLVRPELAPDPRNEVSAELDVLAVEPGYSVGRWARRQFGDDADRRLEELFGGVVPSASERQFQGEVAYVHLSARGFKGRKVRLRGSIYDARTQRPARGLAPLPGTVAAVPIDAPSRSSVQLVFLPDLRDAGPVRTFVRVELFDGDGTIAMADSETLVNGVIPRD